MLIGDYLAKEFPISTIRATAALPPIAESR
jgi:hypothetical protein